MNAKVDCTREAEQLRHRLRGLDPRSAAAEVLRWVTAHPQFRAMERWDPDADLVHQAVVLAEGFAAATLDTLEPVKALQPGDATVASGELQGPASSVWDALCAVADMPHDDALERVVSSLTELCLYQDRRYVPRFSMAPPDVLHRLCGLAERVMEAGVSSLWEHDPEHPYAEPTPALRKLLLESGYPLHMVKERQVASYFGKNPEHIEAWLALSEQTPLLGMWKLTRTSSSWEVSYTHDTGTRGRTTFQDGPAACARLVLQLANDILRSAGYQHSEFTAPEVTGRTVISFVAFGDPSYPQKLLVEFEGLGWYEFYLDASSVFGGPFSVASAAFEFANYLDENIVDIKRRYDLSQVQAVFADHDEASGTYLEFQFSNGTLHFGSVDPKDMHSDSFLSWTPADSGRPSTESPLRSI